MQATVPSIIAVPVGVLSKVREIVGKEEIRKLGDCVMGRVERATLQCRRPPHCKAYCWLCHWHRRCRRQRHADRQEQPGELPAKRLSAACAWRAVRRTSSCRAGTCACALRVRPRSWRAQRRARCAGARVRTVLRSICDARDARRTLGSGCLEGAARDPVGVSWWQGGRCRGRLL